jgi:hypothetical protein
MTALTAELMLQWGREHNACAPGLTKAERAAAAGEDAEELWHRLSPGERIWCLNASVPWWYKTCLKAGGGREYIVGPRGQVHWDRTIKWVGGDLFLKALQEWAEANPYAHGNVLP